MTQSSWRSAGDRKLFVYDVENTREFRISCELNISILNTFGVTLDHKSSRSSRSAWQSGAVKVSRLSNWAY